ncbi:LacI family DNA-binding transcriptional regulator [Granulicella sp. 5B5]|uniref:LacI family DNA-binding transcriptional regulator n=1 Tax=Granulicella sp. 5B5 TaxID=1617967 RepID=UPI0015F391B9|nr:LacI family DNA-binding transcriptional regulator [Granulicella sp. 5B5]QMV18136.1 LacI family DNA-binding transcriptional regulator [Granulicella sp. 5B5]
MAATVRMRDVARLAGVSTMTVSRVLNDTPNVTDAMRKRVNDAIAELRYQPNEVARSLRARRSRQIGILVPYLSDPFFAICANAISTAARQRSYSVVLSTSNEDLQTERDEVSRMLGRNVEGLIIIPAQPTSGRSPLLAPEFKDLPIVTLDRPIAGAKFDSLLVENERGACIGTEHLIKLGHKRIAYIGLSDDLYTMKMRHKGYTAAMAASRLRPEPIHVTRNLPDTLIAIKKLLASRRPPTALFCANNLTTRHVLHSLQSMCIHPPSPIALVGFDDFETADLITPGITVVRQPEELLGRTAAEVLFTRLNETRPKPAKVTTLPVELIIRGSCGAA